VVVAVGIDLCDVARLRRALSGPTGVRFRGRVFTATEQAYCEARGRGRVASYAARFAAKEAAAKALGTGFSDGVAWCDVEVVRAGDRAPELVLHGEAARLARRRRIARWHLSLAHTATTAAAMVVAESRPVSRARRPARAGSAGPRSASRPRPRSRR
jgi:holo-[acyl-carrier protein] synthase